MTIETPLQKRIKRHVIGRTREFFIAVSPGLERVCLEELTGPPLSIEGAAVVSGGIAFEGRLPDCWRANLHLRTANRILMRIGNFKATNFSRLQQHLSATPWELYLTSDAPPRVHVTAAQSRLHHTDAISERVLASVGERLRKWLPTDRLDPHAGGPQRIFVRAAADRFTLSIDSSGELLYKRGVKTQGGSAPIRETVAAAALILAGYAGSEPLVDPMCGSGTFAIEGAMIAARIPPGTFRNFAFMGWPSFAPRKWEYLRQGAKQQTTVFDSPRIFASDIDPDICRSLRTSLDKAGLSSMIDIVSRDFFAFTPGEVSREKGIVTLNPPYGRRLGTHRESQALFRSMLTHLEAAYSGWKIALVAPDTEWIRDIPFPLSHHVFHHGGIRPTLLIGTIP